MNHSGGPLTSQEFVIIFIYLRRSNYLGNTQESTNKKINKKSNLQSNICVYVQKNERNTTQDTKGRRKKFTCLIKINCLEKYFHITS